MDIKLGDGGAVTELGDTIIVMWSAPATLKRWQWWMALQDAFLAKQSKDILCLYLILATSDPPDGKLRWTMQADFKRMGTQIRRQVVVPLGDSVWLAIIRTVVRAILLMSGHSKRQVVTSSIAEAFQRIAEVAGPATPSRTQLIAMVAALAKALGTTLPAEHHQPMAAGS
jgi:hypothetical protein